MGKSTYPSKVAVHAFANASGTGVPAGRGVGAAATAAGFVISTGAVRATAKSRANSAGSSGKSRTTLGVGAHALSSPLTTKLPHLRCRAIASRLLGVFIV